MYPGKFTLLFACLVCPAMASAQDAAEIERIANTMVRLCVAGGRTDAVTGGGSGGADLSLRSLDIKGNLKGEFKVDKKSAEGLVDGINSAMSAVQADQADKVRACLQPVRERLLDVLLPSQRSLQTPTPLPAPISKAEAGALALQWIQSIFNLEGVSGRFMNMSSLPFCSNDILKTQGEIQFAFSDTVNFGQASNITSLPWIASVLIYIEPSRDFLMFRVTN
jgi:hypothetical protein